MSSIKINDKEIKNFNEPYIIAEIGANHNGDMNMAKKLIKNAKIAGADAVKFQLWSKENLFSKCLYEGDNELERQLEEWSFGEEEMREIKKYCDELKITFSCTPFSKENVDFLVDELNVEFIKVASMDINNYPILKYIAETEKPVFLSTGASTVYEIDKAIQTIENTGNTNIVLLHCLCLYPPMDEEINLLNIDMLMDLYEYPVGYSDHSLGIEIPLAAVARGSCVIEKHFTLDKNMEGWDHKISADFEDMKKLVIDSKRISKALGRYRRIPSIREIEQSKIFRRSIVAKRHIPNGKIIDEDSITFKRPGTGIGPEYADLVIGGIAKKDIEKDELINWDDIEVKKQKSDGEIKFGHIQENDA
jgi:N-acetylneuraminate synthase